MTANPTFQTNVLQDGEWVTRTIDLAQVFEPKEPASKPARQRAAKPPDCGILTKTVVESPAVHWILPCRLRSEHLIDMVFVGDHYVQVFELQKDGRLRSIVRRSDFGYRIRNAQVIGSLSNTFEDQAKPVVDTNIEDDDDVVMDDVSTTAPETIGHPRLAPQALLVVLENSDCIFLSLRTKEDGDVDFVISRFRGPSAPLVRLGFHVAVDPSSRYMAISCAQELFVVYELETPATLNRSYARGEPLEYVRSHRPRTVHGVIQKLEFLYPRPEDDYHIILLLIVVRNGKSRMVTYEWEVDDDLRAVFGEEKNGYRLPVEHQMPLLLIPLTVRTAFLAISQRNIAVCKDVLQGPPDFENFMLEDNEASEIHHGLDRPLWTAWTRPYRLPSYFHTKDYIYLAREDGLVTGLDIDSENILGATVKIVKSQCNISTAFCSLYDAYNDILAMGSDAGQGAIWQVPPRKAPIHLGALFNWSPAVDIVTTDEFSTWNQQQDSKGNEMVPWRRKPKDFFKNPDRVFTISGIGTNGAVTEYRYGMTANVGLEIDYEAPVRQCWIFPARIGDPSEPADGFHLVLALPERTAILHLSEDLSQVSEADTDTVQYYLDSRTVAARQISEHVVIQVTEEFIAVIEEGQSIRPYFPENSGTQHTIIDAGILGDMIVISTHVDRQFYIQLLVVSNGTVEFRRSHGVAGEITCMSLYSTGGKAYIVAGLWHEVKPSLRVYSIGDDPGDVPHIVDLDLRLAHDPRENDEGASDGLMPLTEAFISALCLRQDPHTTWIHLGTRGGELLTFLVPDFGGNVISGQMGAVDGIAATPKVEVEATTVKVGLTAATLSLLDNRQSPSTICVCCDSRVTLMRDFDQKKGVFRSKHSLWTMDASNPSAPSAAMTSVTVPQATVFGEGENLPLLLVAGSRILLAELQRQPGVAPRSFPLGGTPSRLIYSQNLDCLIVAVKKDNKPTLVFMDPDNGADLSYPTTKDGEPVEFVSGLGKPGDKIFGLAEWEYRSGNSIWVFILVGTQSGRLLTISTKTLPRNPGEPRARIQYNMRNASKEPGQPIYSVAGEGENIVYCAGNVVHWQTLNSAEKKFQPMKTYQLNSEGTTVRMVDKHYAILTDKDSLSIVNPAGDGGPDEMALSHEDPVARSAKGMIEIGDETSTGRMSLFLVSDRDGGITGLWVPWRQPGKPCEVLFRGALPSSVMKFCRGTTRPPWQQAARRHPAFSHLTSTVDNADVLGVCLDGSLQHFTLLQWDIWMLLRLVQNLALTSPAVNPFTYEEARPEEILDLAPDKADGMHIDGDMLLRCRDRRALEALFEDSRYYDRLVALIRPFAEARGPDVDAEAAVFEVAYAILDYYLEPVLS